MDTFGYRWLMCENKASWWSVTQSARPWGLIQHSKVIFLIFSQTAPPTACGNLHFKAVISASLPPTHSHLCLSLRSFPPLTSVTLWLCRMQCRVSGNLSHSGRLDLTFHNKATCSWCQTCVASLLSGVTSRSSSYFVPFLSFATLIYGLLQAALCRSARFLIGKLLCAAFSDFSDKLSL